MVICPSAQDQSSQNSSMKSWEIVKGSVSQKNDLWWLLRRKSHFCSGHGPILRDKCLHLGDSLSFPLSGIIQGACRFDIRQVPYILIVSLSTKLSLKHSHFYGILRGLKGERGGLTASEAAIPINCVYCMTGFSRAASPAPSKCLKAIVAFPGQPHR